MLVDKVTTSPIQTLQFAQANSPELAANCQADHCSLSEQWSAAYSLWFSSRPANNTRRAYRITWRKLNDFTRKPPWDVTSTDIAGLRNARMKIISGVLLNVKVKLENAQAEHFKLCQTTGQLIPTRRFRFDKALERCSKISG